MNRAAATSDRGSALMAVVGVMAVLVIITLTVTSSSLQALNVTTSIRGGVQAQAAAEAGIDVALAGLQQNPAVCPTDGIFTSPTGTLPVYRAEVWVYSPGRTQGCPTGAETKVQIVSTGHAGFESAGIKSTKVVENTYDGTSAAPPATTGGRVITSYGDFYCDQGCSIVGDVRALGNVTAWNHSMIKGNVHANGKISAKPNSEIDGMQTQASEALPPTIEYDASKFDGFFAPDELNCSISRKYLEEITVPTLLDLRACDGFSLADLTVKLTADVAFILPSHTRLENTVITSEGVRRVWVLIPADSEVDDDDDEDEKKKKKDDDECGADLTMTDVTFSDTISVMISAQCEITLTKTILSGQLFGGRITVSGRNGANKPEYPVSYAPVSFPGTESNDSGSGDSTTGWTLTSSRDLTSADS